MRDVLDVLMRDDRGVITVTGQKLAGMAFYGFLFASVFLAASLV